MNNEIEKKILLYQKTKDPYLLEDIIKRTIRIIGYVIKHYSFPMDNSEDIISQGKIGLYKAIIEYNPNNKSFVSLAVNKIINEIRRYYKNEYAISVIWDYNRRVRKVQKFCTTYYMQYGMMPTKEVILANTNLSETEYDNINYDAKTTSLDIKVNDQDDTKETYLDRIIDDSDENNFSSENKLTMFEIYSYLDTLSDLDKDIMYSYYGLGKEQLSAKEIANKYKLSRQTIYRRISIIINNLQKEYNVDRSYKIVRN